jgi:predicted adenylyl cyclase CyaB
MRNIEIKLRVEDLEGYREKFRLIKGIVQRKSIDQVDTYFNSPSGRLKLRQVTGTQNISELIFYERADTAAPRLSTYIITPVSEPDGIAQSLSEALGVKTVVRKHREVYTWRNVRIHMDTVEGLGSFVELEARLCEGEPAASGEKLIELTLAKLGLEADCAIECSYGELAARQ